MNEKTQVKVDITGDIEGYRRSNAEALAEQKSFQDRMTASDRAMQAAMMRAERSFHQERIQQERQAAEEIRRARARVFESDVESTFFRNLKMQADTLGLSKHQLLEYNASQQLVTKEARALAQANIGKIAAYEREQQFLGNLITYAKRAAAALGAVSVAAAGLKTIMAAAEAERSEARFEAMYRTTGGTAGLSRGQLGDLVDDMTRRTVHTDEQIREAISTLMTYRQVSGEAFKDTMMLAAGIAAQKGGSLASAVMQLGSALEDPARGFMMLRHAGITFTAAQRDMIKDLAEHGRQAEAVTLMLQALKDKGFAAVAEEINRPGGYTRSISDATKAVNEAFEALGKTDAVKVPVVGSLDAISRALINLRQILENGSWYERLLMLTPTPGKFYYLLRTPKQGAAADPDSPEAIAARRAAQEQGWQTGFDTQQADLKKFIEKLDKKAREDSGKFGERFTSEDLREAQRDAAAELKKIQDANDDLSKSALRRLQIQEQSDRAAEAHGEALKKEADAVRAALDPWEKYNQQIEKLERLQRADMLTTAEFSLAQERAIHELGTDLGWLEKKGTDTFKELKQAAEGWGRDTSRAFAKMAFDGRFSLETLGDAVRRFGEELLAIQIQNRMMRPALDLGTSYLDKLFMSNAPLPDASVQAGAYGGFDPGALASFTASAYGNAFRSGRVIPFRQGGVVRRPTFFPMANGGIGLMGEAGEEAVMPLKRTSSGKLGVVAAGGGKMEIHIHEAPGTRASVQQSQDGARLDVFIDPIKDSIARDIMRGDGAVDQALRSRYALNSAPGSYR